MRRLAALGVLLGVMLWLPALAHATVRHPGIRALVWEEHHAGGCWYSYGGTSCSPGYDCSGLVSTAVKAADGIWLGRTTYDMLRSGRLRRDYTPARGNLAFMYGGGHVEIVTAWPHVTYGAHAAGSRVGYLHWGGWPAGTRFYSIRG